MFGGRGEELWLSLSSEGVRFLREQWSWLRELVRWQLRGCSTDPLAELTGLPVPPGPIDSRLARIVDYWCDTREQGPVQQLREGWLLHDLEHALDRVLGTLPRYGGVVTLPGRGHPATVEWGSMLETLHVVMAVYGQTTQPGLPTDLSAADAENHWLSMCWLELVLDTLAQADHTIPVQASR
jgi:hypothetical protein